MKNILVLNVFGMLVVKFFSMIVSLMIIPYYLAYFGDSEALLGKWLAFFTIIMIFLTIDFGVGSKLKNDLITSVDDKFSLIVNAATSNTIVTFFLLSISCLLYFLLYFVLGYAEEAGDGLLDWTVLVIALIFLLIMSPLKVIIPILQSQQKNWLSAFVLLMPQIYILVYLFFNKSANYTEMLYINLMACLSITTITTYSLISYVLYKQQVIIRKGNSQNKSMLNSAISYIKVSFPFFIAQVSMILLFSSNEIIYSLIGQDEKIVHYQYYYRVFSLVFVTFSSISMPFWSAMRKCYSFDEHKKIRILFFILCLLVVPTSIVLLIVSYNYQLIVDLWLGSEKFYIELDAILLFTILSILMCIMYACSALLNSLEVLKFQATIYIIACLIKLSIAYVLIDGIFDPVLVSTVVSLFFISFCFVYKAIKEIYLLNNRSLYEPGLHK
jgi:O-antigen/teichoic acid export membrane protein